MLDEKFELLKWSSWTTDAEVRVAPPFIQAWEQSTRLTQLLRQILVRNNEGVDAAPGR